MKILAEYGGPKEKWNKSHISISEYEETWFFKINSVNFWLKKGYKKSDLQLIDSENFKKNSKIKKIFLWILQKLV